MRPSVVEEDIKILSLSKGLTDKLRKENMNSINDIWILKRKELKELSFTDQEIKSIIISLQLRGLDLNKKIYH
ncbi:MAG TPA: hypothetical protein DCE23_00925 [Firmicutes bacterium]|nr:hypothetical protein [Bacillota bacterium]